MENAKRILFVITQSEWGGAQSYVLKTALEARGRGFEVLVATGGDDELKQRCIEQNIDYRMLDNMRRSISPLKDLQVIWELVTLIRLWMPSTVYLHSSKAGIVGSIAARIAKARHVVYRIGGWSFLDPVSPNQQFIRRWSEKLTARFKDVIIVLHPGDKELAKRCGIRPKHELVIIPNGMNVERFDIELLPRVEARTHLKNSFGQQPAASSQPLDPPLILTVANFYATKDLIRYMNAIRLVHERVPNAKFLIIGDGDERKEIEAKRDELNLTQVVSLPGKRDDIATLLRGADLFVLPSVKEGMPWTLLEAMTARIPCIATDVGANAWMLGENGRIVPPKKPGLLSHAIVDALQHPSMATERAERARIDIETRFTEREMFKQTFDVIQ